MYCMTGRSRQAGEDPPEAGRVPTGVWSAIRGFWARAASGQPGLPGTWGPGGSAEAATAADSANGLTSGGPAPTKPDQPGQAGHDHAQAEDIQPERRVSSVLRQAAAWSWCILLTGLVVYLAFRLAVALRLVVLPFIAAMLLTALLNPPTAWLRRHGVRPVLATWCSLLAAIIVIAGAIALFANRVSADYPTLFHEVQKTAGQIQRSLAGPPFHLNSHRLQQLSNSLVNYLSAHKSVIAGTVVTGGRYAIEVLTGVILTLFTTFFLLKDGARIWAWLISGFRTEAHRRVTNAGDAGWRALVNYVRGTVAVAAIHALLLGLTLWLLGIPLLVPFIVLIFLAAFVPIIGILVVGTLAILVALATQGWVAAVILLAVLLAENQIEAHLLQPLVVGRIVRLHPLGIILVLAVGAIVAGIPGAIIAVPLAAVITYAWPALRGDPPHN